jgi:hypothetical protein
MPRNNPTEATTTMTSNAPSASSNTKAGSGTMTGPGALEDCECRDCRPSSTQPQTSSLSASSRRPLHSPQGNTPPASTILAMNAESGTLLCRWTAPGNVHTTGLIPHPSLTGQELTSPGSYACSFQPPSNQPTISRQEYWEIRNGTPVRTSVATYSQDGTTQTVVSKTYPDGTVQVACTTSQVMYPLPSLPGGTNGQNAGYQVTPPQAYLGTPSTPTNHILSDAMGASRDLGPERWNPNVELLRRRIGVILSFMAHLEWRAPVPQESAVCPWTEEKKYQLLSQTYQTNEGFRSTVVRLAATYGEAWTDNSELQTLLHHFLSFYATA